MKPDRRETYAERLGRCARERRARTSSKQKREWPRRTPHVPPKPPRLLTMNDKEKAGIVEMLKKAGALPPPEVDAATLQSYVGKYKGETGPEIAITLTEGKLFAVATGQRPFALIAINTTTFRPLAFEGMTITFNVEAGRITGIGVHQGPTTTQMKRVEEESFTKGVEIEKRRTRMVEAETTKVAKNIMEVFCLKNLKRIGREIVYLIMHTVEDESLIVQQDRGKNDYRHGECPAPPRRRSFRLWRRARRTQWKASRHRALSATVIRRHHRPAFRRRLCRRGVFLIPGRSSEVIGAGCTGEE